MSDYEKEKLLKKEVKKNFLLEEEEKAFGKILEKQKHFDIDYPEQEEEIENPKARESRLLREQKEKELEEELNRQEKEAEEEALRRQDETRGKHKNVIVLDIEKEKELNPKEKETEIEQEVCKEIPCDEETEEEVEMKSDEKKHLKGILWIVLGLLITIAGVGMSIAGLLPYGIFTAAAGIAAMLIGCIQRKKSIEEMDDSADNKTE